MAQKISWKHFGWTMLISIAFACCMAAPAYADEDAPEASSLEVLEVAQGENATQLAPAVGVLGEAALSAEGEAPGTTEQGTNGEPVLPAEGLGQSDPGQADSEQASLGQANSEQDASNQAAEEQEASPNQDVLETIEQDQQQVDQEAAAQEGQTAENEAPLSQPMKAAAPAQSAQNTALQQTPTSTTSAQTSSGTSAAAALTVSPQAASAKLSSLDASTNSTDWERLAGATALDTMREIVKEGFTSATTAVIASADSYKDALVAASLAGKYEAPVLLTAKKSLSTQTRSELVRLGTKHVFLIGGTAAISNDVQVQLRKMGLIVERIAGATAAQTAIEVAKRLGTNESKTAIVVTGSSYKDALSISPYSYAKKAPIFLSDSKTGLSQETVSAVKQGNYSRVIVIGGTSAVPASVETQLKSAGVEKTKRLADTNAIDTSAKVAQWCINEEGMNRNNMGIATSKSYKDAVTGSALCGKNNTVLVLVEDANRSAVKAIYRDHISEVSKGYVFGGTSAVSQVTWDYIHQPVGATTIIPSERTISDGLYIIRFDKNKGFVLDAANGGVTAGTNVQLWSSNGSLAQKWQITWDGRGYSLRNFGSGTALAVAGGSMVSGANVLLANYAKNDAQLWAIAKSGSAYVIRNLKSGMALDAAGGKAANKVNIRVYAPNNSTAQKFVFAKTEPLTDGTVYTFYVAANKNMVMDDPSHSTAQGMQMQISKKNGSLAQKFVARRIAENTYALQPLASGLYLEDTGSKIVQTARTGSAAQQWSVKMGNGGVMIVNKSTGKAIERTGNKTTTGTKLTSSSATNKAAQRFVVSPVPVIDNGVYTINSALSGKVLDLSGASFKDGTNITIRGKNGSVGQAFKFTKVGDYYTIVNALTGKPVEVAGASKAKGANVRQGANGSGDSKLWKAVISADGYIQFQNKASGLVLDVAGGKNANGTNVQQYSNSASAGQKWRVYKSSYTYDAAVSRALSRNNNASSSTRYMISVDKTAHKVMIFKGSAGNWKLDKNYLCSVGANGKTPSGTFTIGSRGYSFGHGYTCYYWTQFWGNYLFHSTKYYEGTFKHKDARLGKNISAGCIRLQIDNAKWINRNIPTGTKVFVYN